VSYGHKNSQPIIVALCVDVSCAETIEQTTKVMCEEPKEVAIKIGKSFLFFSAFIFLHDVCFLASVVPYKFYACYVKGKVASRIEREDL
jgi:hypothetical protein